MGGCVPLQLQKVRTTGSACMLQAERSHGLIQQVHTRSLGKRKLKIWGKCGRTGRLWILICQDHRPRILGPVRAHEREKFFFLLSIHLVSSFLFSFSIFLFFSRFFLVCLGNALPLLDGSWYGKTTEIQVRSMTVYSERRERGIASVASVML